MKPHMKQLIMGKNCIKEVLKLARERVLALYTSHNKQDDPAIHSLICLHKIPIHLTGKKDLDRMVNSESHQGYVAEVKPRKDLKLSDFLNALDEEKRATLLLLDTILDPQNLGAILRAAECFGVDAVVWSKNRGADVTPVVSKASVGASELLNIIKISNLADAVHKLKDAGFQIVTAEVGTKALPIKDVLFSPRVALIMGSEGMGVQPLVSKLADLRVYIPMRGQIDSLNVSQATAVFLASIDKDI